MRLRIVLAAALVSSCVRSGACMRCGPGEYELLGAVKCGACTNGPENSFYTASSTAGSESCGWDCTSGYVKTPRGDACEERDTVTVNFALTSHEFILTPADFSLLEDSFAEAVAGALTAAVDSEHVGSASFAAHDVVVLRCDLLPAGQGNDLAIDVRIALPRSNPTQLGSPEPADIDLEALLLSDWVLREASRAFSQGTGREMTLKAVQEGSDWVSGLRPRGVPHSCRTAAEKHLLLAVSERHLTVPLLAGCACGNYGWGDSRSDSPLFMLGQVAWNQREGHRKVPPAQPWSLHARTRA